MPYKANEARRHKIPRARYRVANWPAYDRALQQRGSLTVWVTPQALAAWHPPKTGRRGRGDRDRAPAAPGLRPTLAAGGRSAALAHGPAPARLRPARLSQ